MAKGHCFKPKLFHVLATLSVVLILTVVYIYKAFAVCNLWCVVKSGIIRYWSRLEVVRMRGKRSNMLNVSADENHWFELRPGLFFPQLLNLVYPNMKTTDFQHNSKLLIVKHLDPSWHVHLNGKLDCTCDLHRVCVCSFSCLEYASGLETSLNVSGVSISFTWTSSHSLRSRNKPVFTASTKCFPSYWSHI